MSDRPKPAVSASSQAPTVPRLHFAHANGFPIATYRQFLSPLSPHYRIATTDFIGHHPDYPVTNNWNRLCDHLIHDVEQHHEPVVGVGHSLGGGLMFMASQRRPDLFRAVVMLDVPLMTTWEATALAVLKRTPWGDRVTPAGRAARRRNHWSSQQEAYAYLARKKLFHRFPPAVLWDYIQAATEPVPDDGQADSVQDSAWTLRYRPEIEAEIFRTFPTHLTRHYRDRHPALQVVQGAETDVVKPHHVRLMRDRLGIPVHTWPGGHLFPLEQPQASAEQLLDLLDNVLADAPASTGEPIPHA